MKFSTRSKIALAGLAYRGVSLARGLVGRDDIAEVRRLGVRWRLDLSEGIDFSIYLLGAFERDTVAACRRLVEPGATVLDIGANIGAHTLPLAGLVGATGRVIAFEPTVQAFAKLSANIALNPALAPRIACHQVVLSDFDTTVAPDTIAASWPLVAANDTLDEYGGRAWSTEGARIQTLDRFCADAGLDKIDLIKMDVDGAEPAILQGAETILRRDRPVMILELAPTALERVGSGLGSYIGHLRRLGYRIHDQVDDTLLDDDLARLAASIPKAGCLNIVARPEAVAR